MPGSENQVVKIRLVAEGNQNKNEPNFYYLKNSTVPRSGTKHRIYYHLLGIKEKRLFYN
jgi:hypothetical protein